jgi:hypothetical protein
VLFAKGEYRVGFELLQLGFAFNRVDAVAAAPIHKAKAIPKVSESNGFFVSCECISVWYDQTLMKILKKSPEASRE